MHPILLEWGPIVIPSWHAFYVLGATAAFALLQALGRRHAPEIAESELARLYIVCYVAGYFGARLLSILIEEPQVVGVVETLQALGRFGAMTFYGGAVGAFLAGAVYVRVRRLPLATLVDVGLPAGLVALAVGRIGCFLNGDDFGTPVPWGIVLPNLKDGIPRHPVQLYEAAAVTLLVLVLVGFFGRIRAALRPGAVGLFAVAGYANLRFVLEHFRADFRGFAFGSWLSTSQFIAVLTLLACGLTLPYWLRTPRT